MRCKQYSIRQEAEYEDYTDYDSGRLVLGIDEDKQPFSLNMRKSNKILAIAQTGSGKSVLQEGLMSRFYAAGGLCAVPTDIKGEEYAMCSRPAQKANWDKLLKFPTVRPVDEKPIGLPMRTYYPYFFTRLVSRRFGNQSYCQFKFEDINMYDFLTMAGIQESDLSPLQKSALERVFAKVKSGVVTDYKTMEKFLSKTKGIGKSTTNLLITTARQLETQDVMGKKYPPPNFVEDIKNRFVPVLNTYGSTSTGKRANTYVSAYVAILLRKIYGAKADGVIPRRKHLLIVLDEIARFCPSDSNPSSRVAILDMLRLSRSEKISMFSSCQFLTDVPEIMADQTTHIMIPARMNTETIRAIMQRFAPWENDNAMVMA